MDYKKKIYSQYKKTDFPVNMVDKTCLDYKDYLFDSNQQNTQLSKPDLSKGYIQDEQPKRKVWRNTVEETKPANNTNTYQTRSIPPFEQFKIDNIFLINKKLQLSNDSPLWYVINTLGHQYGPLSSNQISNMYEAKTLDANWEGRLLDIFQIKNIPNFKFVSLKHFNNDNWIEDVMDSTLLELTELWKLSWNIANNKPKENNIQTKTENITIINEKKSEEVKSKEEPIFVQEVNNVQNKTSDEWEVVGKGKGKGKKKEDQPQVYLLGAKKKEVVKEEPKPKFKVEIVSGEELVNSLKPKKK